MPRSSSAHRTVAPWRCGDAWQQPDADAESSIPPRARAHVSTASRSARSSRLAEHTRESMARAALNASTARSTSATKPQRLNTQTPVSRSAS